jgi:DNA recombination protein RmuC
MTATIIILATALCALIVYIGFLWRTIASARTAESSAVTRAEAESAQSVRLREELETIRQSKSESDTTIQQLRENIVRAAAETARLTQLLELSRADHQKQMKEAEERNADMLRRSEANFKIMANEIMNQQSETLRQQNEQKIGDLLQPLKENIDRFRSEVSQCYSTEARERFSLQEKIKELIEANNNIGREARELSSALRGNSKKQGDWGELVLENILESSGLRKGEEFIIQQTTDESGATLRDEQGRGLRPDVVVRCPDGKVMVIDSKVSLTAFVDYVNTDDPTEQDRLGKLHLTSVLKHINELSEKNYQDYVGREKLDFVMMFIPNEAAYGAAMTLDPTLWQKAYDKRVLLVSPTQLIGSLRLINQLWNHDRQTRNAIEIAEKSGQMYDKFAGFVADMEKIDKGISATRTAYDNAIKKLRDGRGNLIGRAEALRKLGIKASKRLPKSDIEAPEDEDEDQSDVE